MSKRKECRFARSDDTPCVVRDGPVAYAADLADRPVCVGCGRPPGATGIPPDPKFADQLAKYKRDQERRRR